MEGMERGNFPHFSGLLESVPDRYDDVWIITCCKNLFSDIIINLEIFDFDSGHCALLCRWVVPYMPTNINLIFLPISQGENIKTWLHGKICPWSAFCDTRCRIPQKSQFSWFSMPRPNPSLQDGKPPSWEENISQHSFFFLKKMPLNWKLYLGYSVSLQLLSQTKCLPGVFRSSTDKLQNALGVQPGVGSKTPW